jgi:SSS family solute:Na+ symporter
MVETGGWNGMVQRIQANFPGQDFTHMWGPMHSFAANPMGIHWTGIVFGLGAVQSMGYWTTDFLVVQRVLSARDIRSAKLAPIIGSFFKMAVPLIVILPGLLGLAVLPMHLVPASPHLAPGEHSYNEVLPLMLARYCGPGLLGLGITALVAGFMAGMAGNVSAFATVWTYDIYRPYIYKTAPDKHYVSMGRWCTLIGLVISIGTAYFVMRFASIMDYVQALFGFFIAPLFGTVVLGMLWKRVSRMAGFLGLLAGTTSSVTMFLLMKFDPDRWVRVFALSPLAKGLAQDMYQALWSCVTCVVVTVLVTLVTKPRPDQELVGLVYSLTPLAKEEHATIFHKPAFWGAIALVIFVILQIIFW